MDKNAEENARKQRAVWKMLHPDRSEGEAKQVGSNTSAEQQQSKVEKPPQPVDELWERGLETLDTAKFNDTNYYRERLVEIDKKINNGEGNREWLEKEAEQIERVLALEKKEEEKQIVNGLRIAPITDGPYAEAVRKAREELAKKFNGIKSIRTDKKCPRCHIVKPIEQFISGKAKAPKGYCNPCMAQDQKERRENRKFYGGNPGLCTICGQEQKTLCVDHDHMTGEARGLLCSNCNSGLGMFQDNIEIFERVIIYLKTHRDKVRA